MRGFAILLVVGILVAGACTEINTDAPLFPPRDAAAAVVIPLGPTFDSLNQNIFQPRCAEICHSGGANASGNMDLGGVDPYAAMVNVVASGPQCGTTGLVRVIPGDPDDSLLYEKVLAKERNIAAPCGDSMPQGSALPSLSDDEIEFIRMWIEAGATR